MRSAWPLFACAALGFLVVGCRAQPEVPLPLTECIGRLEFGAPGSLDVEASGVTHYPDGRWLLAYTEYQDGTMLVRVDNLKARGVFRVSHAKTAAQMKKSKARIERSIQNEYQLLKEWSNTKQGRESAQALLPPRPLRHQTGHSWGRVGHAVLMYIGDHELEWRTNDRSPEAEAMFDALDRGARPRKLGEAPQEPGLCLPYVFVPIREAFDSYVSVHYRLLDHPEVEILLTQEWGAEGPEPAQSLQETLERRVKSMWGDMYTRARSIQPIDHGMTQLAGSPAHFRSAKFVRLAGEDLDYGYLVVSAGDPAQARKTPRVQLQIWRYATRALRQGREPMDKEQFFALARAIHASVKLRAWGEAGLAAVEKTAATSAP